jgi:hypothetical protein
MFSRQDENLWRSLRFAGCFAAWQTTKNDGLPHGEKVQVEDKCYQFAAKVRDDLRAASQPGRPQKTMVYPTGRSARRRATCYT